MIPNIYGEKKASWVFWKAPCPPNTMKKNLLVIYELMNYLFANQLGLMIFNKHILFTIVSHFDKCSSNVIIVASIFL
jgi:hypothetical protein